MGRIRAKYAKSETDRNAFGHLEKAEDSLKKALAAYEKTIRTLPSDEKRKVHERMHLIHSALSAIGSVRPLESRVDKADSDLKADRRNENRSRRGNR